MFSLAIKAYLTAYLSKPVQAFFNYLPLCRSLNLFLSICHLLASNLETKHAVALASHLPGTIVTPNVLLGGYCIHCGLYVNYFVRSCTVCMLLEENFCEGRLHLGSVQLCLDAASLTGARYVFMAAG